MHKNIQIDRATFKTPGLQAGSLTIDINYTGILNDQMKYVNNNNINNNKNNNNNNNNNILEVSIAPNIKSRVKNTT